MTARPTLPQVLNDRMFVNSRRRLLWWLFNVLTTLHCLDVHRACRSHENNLLSKSIRGDSRQHGAGRAQRGKRSSTNGVVRFPLLAANVSVTKGEAIATAFRH